MSQITTLRNQSLFTILLHEHFAGQDDSANQSPIAQAPYQSISYPGKKLSLYLLTSTVAKKTLREESIDDMTLCKYAVQYHGSLGALLDDRSAVVDAVKGLSLDTAPSAMSQERTLPYGERSAFPVAEADGNPFHLAYLYIELTHPPHPFLLA